jgi:hypothetical protein
MLPIPGDQGALEGHRGTALSQDAMKSEEWGGDCGITSHERGSEGVREGDNTQEQNRLHSAVNNNN